jgi:pimeloyl-ACP methyl ester carboxylesterase
MGPVILILIVGLVIGVGYEAYAEQRDRAKHPPPGKLVDVGGYRLHLHVMGEDNSAPTVILDAGMVSFSSNWAWVQPEIAKVARVVAYDRAGLGWSDAGLKPRDAGQSAKELHTALQKAGISRPYIYVGHSYGGLMAQAFAALYRDEVAGIVMVDGSHPDQWARIGVKSTMMGTGNKAASVLGRVGLWRIFNREPKTLAEGLPQPQYDEIMAFCFLPGALATGGDAGMAWDTISRPLVNNAGKLGDIPLTVISVTENDPRVGKILVELQNELPMLSTNSQHIIVEGAGHENLVGKRENAAKVTAAILDVIEQARGS